MTMPLLIIAAYATVYTWERIRRPFLRLVFVAAVFVPSIYITSFIVLAPKDAPIPLADRGQFIEDWPAGGGVKEVVTYLTAEAAHQKVNVYTEGTFGLMPYAIELYLVDNPNVKITGIWPLPDDMPQEISRDASVSATYFVLNESQTLPSKWSLTLIGEYEKANREDHKKLRFYRVGVLPAALP